MSLDPSPLPPSAGSLLLTKEDRTWAMVSHLGAFAGHVFPLAHVIVPLIVWQMKKDSSAFVDDQGKESVNAQISFTIYMAVAVVLCFVVIGIPLAFGLWLANVILVIIASIAANEGRIYRYPFIIRFLK